MNRVLITGAGRGLGMELTKQHVQRQDLVFAAYRTLTPQLEQLAAAYENVSLIHMDVTDAKSVKTASKQVIEKTDYLDIIYNNAGLYRFEDEVPFEELDIEGAMEVYNINTLGILRVIQNLFPLIIQGTLVCCISSDSGSVQDMAAYQWKEGDRYINYPYYLSKAAANMAGCILKNELMQKGADIILVHPGWMKTDMGGPNAVVPVQDSAQGIVAITCREKPITGRFVDYQGNTLNW